MAVEACRSEFKCFESCFNKSGGNMKKFFLLLILNLPFVYSGFAQPILNKI
ncbi:hypothetical protein Cabys_2989 [Caldithrix abyssi DSM 13497]|uniref:Uncharacterized protein n=1 Tax=Caldithrix abyssi DSM 13497 TaxID=880073 RepID=A0A1J1CBT9_CALAY|nr:hypothetical protein Cabys_2989 [Caldithrix abyssi DSM 13497]